MSRVIVAIAPVGPPEMPHPEHNPTAPRQVAEEVIACAQAGASLAHLHVRDAAGRLTGDLSGLRSTLDTIRSATDIVIQGSTGGLSTLSLDERCVALADPRVEVASLNMGSVNMYESAYVNTLPDIRYWAGRMRAVRVLPELEIFEAGMIHTVAMLAEEGVLTAPLVFGLALGFPGALPATPASLMLLRNLLPAGSAWGLAHHGMTDLSLLAAAIGLGASVARVGYEDGWHYGPGRVARSNRELVEQLVRMIDAMGLEVATPAQARQMLGLDAAPRASSTAESEGGHA